MSKIIFLVQHLGQPRCIKRIISAKKAGFEVEVHGFDWGNYSENIKQLTDNGITIKTIVPSKGLSKIQKLYEYARMVRKVARTKAKDDVIYAFGFELATFSRLLTRAKYVYECADVVAARENSAKLKKIDKKNLDKAAFTVFTSEGFADYFWGEERNKPAIKEKYVLMPNKLNSYFLTTNRPAAHHISEQKVRFGFVGLFRFLNIYLRFCELIGEEHPNYEFHFWGDSDELDVERIREFTNKYNNIFLHGSFTNPHDLPMVYDSFDICVTCYDIRSGNVRIAEPNKLYESIYFNKPIIVSRGTFLGKKVEQMNVGLAIDSTPEGIKVFLDTIDVEKVNDIIDTESLIASKELIDNTEELFQKLHSITR